MHDPKKEEKEALLAMGLHEPPPTATGSSRLPTPTEVAVAIARVALGLAACVAVAWLGLFVCLCVLLARANTPEVHAACAGFWDFMLVAVLAPVAIPCLYCVLACCVTSWHHFSGGCALVMAIACLHSSLMAGQSPACVEALRRTSPPMPLLLFCGFGKAALFLAAALSSLCAHRAARRGAAQTN